ncbi:MAG: hypothetical protein HJJLKODD_01582 [Phycisphaerae bacterium]|nr:hypothetical protein [Phycisphaerae bacterium]
MHMISTLVTVLAAMWISTEPTSPAPATDIKVQAVKVAETRSVQLQPDGPKMKYNGQPGQAAQLAVTVELIGAQLAQVVQYGQLKINSAADDQGQPLKAPEESFSTISSGMQEVDRQSMYFWYEEVPTDRIQFDLIFEPTARTAKQIKTIDAAIQLNLVAEKRQIVFENPTGLADQKLTHADLEAAKLNISLGKSEGEEAKNTIKLQINGSRDGLIDAELQDASGKKLETSRMTWSMGDNTEMSLQSWEPLPEGVKLVLTVGIGQQTLNVPIKLENINLP